MTKELIAACKPGDRWHYVTRSRYMEGPAISECVCVHATPKTRVFQIDGCKQIVSRLHSEFPDTPPSPSTPEELEAARIEIGAYRDRRIAIDRLRRVDWSAISVDTMRKMLALLDGDGK